jgi:hypothetical protein
MYMYKSINMNSQFLCPFMTLLWLGLGVFFIIVIIIIIIILGVAGLVADTKLWHIERNGGPSPGVHPDVDLASMGRYEYICIYICVNGDVCIRIYAYIYMCIYI